MVASLYPALVDERDCRLLMELARSPFASFESLGRTLGMSGTATKTRLVRLAHAGIFQGLALTPSPAALGLHGRLAVYGGAPVAASPAQLAQVPEAAWAATAYPPSSVVLLYREDPDAPLPPELAALAGRPPDSITIPSDPREAAARPPLSPLDWRVMRALLEAPRGTVRALAEATGLSERVVRERRDRMLASGDVAAFPMVDATREAGAIYYNAYVAARRAEDLRGFRFPNAQRVTTHHDPPAVFLAGFVRTYAEAHVAEERLRALPGAAHVSFTVPQGIALATPRLREWVDAQIARWDAARRKPRVA